MSRDFQKYHPGFVAGPMEPDYIFCIDCKLEKEPERLWEVRCLLCERAWKQKTKEAGNG